eukprot:101406-Chlamydomonas_euryale.AAC.6
MACARISSGADQCYMRQHVNVIGCFGVVYACPCTELLTASSTCMQITKYTNIEGYMFNIKFLKKAFNPIFELHEAWVSDADAVTTRWTMTMEFTATKGLPIVGKVFRPTITFTGTSTYVYNPSSGKISMHIDEWDSIKNQEFFSVEGFADFFKQLLQPFSAPDLETPGFTLLKCVVYSIACMHSITRTQ